MHVTLTVNCVVYTFFAVVHYLLFFIRFQVGYNVVKCYEDYIVLVIKKRSELLKVRCFVSKIFCRQEATVLCKKLDKSLSCQVFVWTCLLLDNKFIRIQFRCKQLESSTNIIFTYPTRVTLTLKPVLRTSTNKRQSFCKNSSFSSFCRRFSSF